MKGTELLRINLTLFDGGGSAGDGGGQSSGQGESTTGEAPAAPGSTRRGNKTGKKSGEYSGVLFGKQTTQAAEKPQAPSPDAGRDTNKEGSVTVTSDTLEEKQRAFQELVNGEYKDVYTQDTQRIIDRRFREAKAMEERIGANQPVIDMLLQRYNIQDGDLGKLTEALENDDAYWTGAAEEAGMDVAQYKQFQKLQRENESLKLREHRQMADRQAQERYAGWMQQAEQLQTVYPGFDLATESKNPHFVSLLRSGVPVQHAYEVLHMEDIKSGVAQSTAKETQRQVVEGIRSKGTRPAENGTSTQSAFTVKDDPSKWSKKDRAEVMMRVARGEKIIL